MDLLPSGGQGRCEEKGLGGGGGGGVGVGVGCVEGETIPEYEHSSREDLGFSCFAM